MELMAAISALTFIMAAGSEEESVVLIYSDSEYVVKGFMDKTRARLKNVDLWNVLDNLSSWFELVHMEHVKGHAGHADNEAVDRLAGEFRQAAVQELKC
jgi:ribonuclease HI